MKLAVKILAGIILFAALLLVGSGLAAKTLLTGSRINALMSQIETRLGTKVSAKGGDLDLLAWILLRPVVSIEGFTIHNPPGFGDENLLTTKRVAAELALRPLLDRRIEIRTFELEEPDARIERNRGRSNLEAVLAASSAKTTSAPPSEPSSTTALSIDRLRISRGRVRYFEAGRSSPVVSVSGIGLEVENFGRDRSANVTLTAKLFDGEKSTFSYKGKAGPFGESIPASGDLLLVAAPAEMPKAFREQMLGDVLREPGDAARASLQASISGDVTTALRGKGKITLTDFQLGRDKNNRVPLRGEAPLAVTVEKPLADPGMVMEVENGTLALGKGQWKGRAELNYSGARLRGSSSGSISGVEISEMLAAFTSTGQVISGQAAIPEYRITFNGRDAAELRGSLNGQGVITIDNGRFALFDLLRTIEKYSDKLLGGEAPPAQGETQFQKLRTSFQIAEGRVTLPDLIMEYSPARLNGQGFFTMSQELNFDLNAGVAGSLAERLGAKAGPAGTPPIAMVPVRVRGTVQSPKVYPDVRRLAVEQVKERAIGILDRILKKK